MVKNGNQRIVDDLTCPKRSYTKTCYTENKAADSHTLIPRCIGKGLVMWVGNLAVQDFADNTKDVNRRHHNTGTSNDCSRAMEDVVIGKRTDKDCQPGKPRLARPATT